MSEMSIFNDKSSAAVVIPARLPATLVKPGYGVGLDLGESPARAEILYVAAQFDSRRGDEAPTARAEPCVIAIVERQGVVTF